MYAIKIDTYKNGSKVGAGIYVKQYRNKSYAKKIATKLSRKLTEDVSQVAEIFKIEERGNYGL